ncbi:7 transmembrane receptor (rhodopsin family) domain-containing protein [Ditylenchus destructor]|nr:7 transmembrane receptor (rhodopsin family) domain-containing protein [Ditylenchus destructor]
MHNRPQTSQTSLIASLACICSILASNFVHGYLEPHPESAHDFGEKSATQRPTPRFSTLPESLFLSPQGTRPLQSAEHTEVVPSRRVFISPIRKRDPGDGEAGDESEDIAVVDLPVGASTTPAHPTSQHQKITTSDPTLSPYVTQRGNDDSTSLFVTHPIVAVLICILVIVLIVATVVGNCMVCLAVLMVRKLKSQPANLLLISLAVADCCVGLLVMPVALVNILDERWILGEVVCRLWTSADLTLCTASILNLCLISVDRYLAVTRALRYAATRTRRRMYCYIAVVWVGALFVSVIPLILLPLKDVDNSCQIPALLFYGFPAISHSHLHYHCWAMSFWQAYNNGKPAGNSQDHTDIFTTAAAVRKGITVKERAENALFRPKVIYLNVFVSSQERLLKAKQ